MIFLYFYSIGMVFMAGAFLESLIQIKNGDVVVHSPISLIYGLVACILIWPYTLYKMWNNDGSGDHSWLVSPPIRPVIFDDEDDEDEPMEVLLPCTTCNKETQPENPVCTVCGKKYFE